MIEARIAVVDDRPLYRGALALVPQSSNEKFELVEAGSLDELLGKLQNGLEIDLATLDLSPPGIRSAPSRGRARRIGGRSMAA
jgi:CheY-like chemotaxis protein